MSSRYPLADVRRLPTQTAHRLRLVHYDAPGDILPNGLRRPDTIIATGALRVGNDFHILARVRQDKDGARVLEVDAMAFDTLLSRPCALPFSDALLRGVYDELARAHVLAKARQHGCSVEGRN